jgi:hypothetical protein
MRSVLDLLEASQGTALRKASGSCHHLTGIEHPTAKTATQGHKDADPECYKPIQSRREKSDRGSGIWIGLSAGMQEHELTHTHSLT